MTSICKLSILRDRSIQSSTAHEIDKKDRLHRGGYSLENLGLSSAPEKPVLIDEHKVIFNTDFMN